jgi:itaconate CoA-transferase
MSSLQPLRTVLCAFRKTRTTTSFSRYTRLAAPSCYLSQSTTRRNAFAFNAPGARPLEGITVVALEQVISGPYCTRQLADLGARVIKIERPGLGDFVRYHDKRVKGLCSHFVWTNRNKESIALDVKKPEDMKVLLKLLKKADVFVANLIPGATERLGLGYDKLKELNERLIFCEISGYGSDGPYKKKKAYDLLVQSEAGFLSVTGTPDQPAKSGASIADISAGMYAFCNIMAALLQRNKTGKGCKLDVSMLESMVEWMGFPMYYAYNGQSPPVRAGASHAAIYPYGQFQTGKGSVMLGIQNEREWVILCEKVLGLPDLAKEERFINSAARVKNRDELYDIICEVFGKWTADETIDKLEEAGIANAMLRDMEGVWNHPQLKARRRFREVETEAGTVPTTIFPGMSADVEPRLDPVPGIGEHTEKILAELKEQE